MLDKKKKEKYIIFPIGNRDLNFNGRLRYRRLKSGDAQIIPEIQFYHGCRYPLPLVSTIMRMQRAQRK